MNAKTTISSSFTPKVNYDAIAMNFSSHAVAASKEVISNLISKDHFIETTGDALMCIRKKAFLKNVFHALKEENNQERGQHIFSFVVKKEAQKEWRKIWSFLMENYKENGVYEKVVEFWSFGNLFDDFSNGKIFDGYFVIRKESIAFKDTCDRASYMGRLEAFIVFADMLTKVAEKIDPKHTYGFDKTFDLMEFGWEFEVNGRKEIRVWDNKDLHPILGYRTARGAINYAKMAREAFSRATGFPNPETDYRKYENLIHDYVKRNNDAIEKGTLAEPHNARLNRADWFMEYTHSAVLNMFIDNSNGLVVSEEGYTQGFYDFLVGSEEIRQIVKELNSIKEKRSPRYARKLQYLEGKLKLSDKNVLLTDIGVKAH